MLAPGELVGVLLVWGEALQRQEASICSDFVQTFILQHYFLQDSTTFLPQIITETTKRSSDSFFPTSVGRPAGCLLSVEAHSCNCMLASNVRPVERHSADADAVESDLGPQKTSHMRHLFWEDAGYRKGAACACKLTQSIVRASGC